MATNDLVAERRTILGKKVKQLRRTGVVPANVYGLGESIAIQAQAAELRRVVRAAGHTGLVRIVLEATPPLTTVVRDVRKKSMTGELVHVDFQSVSMTETMTVRVPVQLVGQAPIVEENGMLFHALDSVEVQCLPGDIPQIIEADISGMATMDAVVHVRDLVLPAGVEMLTDGDLVVANVAASRVEAEETALAAEAEAATEAESAT